MVDMYKHWEFLVTDILTSIFLFILVYKILYFFSFIFLNAYFHEKALLKDTCFHFTLFWEFIFIFPKLIFLYKLYFLQEFIITFFAFLLFKWKTLDFLVMGGGGKAIFTIIDFFTFFYHLIYYS